MKKFAKILALLLLLAFLAANMCCSSNKVCRTMKYHNDDVERGLAH